MQNIIFSSWRYSYKASPWHLSRIKRTLLLSEWILQIDIAPWIVHALIKYLASSHLDDLVHQIDEIWALIWFLILFSEVFDCLVYEFFQISYRLVWIRDTRKIAPRWLVLVEVMKEIKEFSHILFAFSVTVWLIEQVKGFNKDVQTLL